MEKTPGPMEWSWFGVLSSRPVGGSMRAWAACPTSVPDITNHERRQLAELACSGRIRGRRGRRAEGGRAEGGRVEGGRVECSGRRRRGRR
eukprot:1286083-Rhodomonas_salina.1